IEFLKGDALVNNESVFSGIDTSWNRVKGGKAIGDILYKVEKEFNFKDPSVHIADLMKAFQLLQNIEDQHWKTIKTDELKVIIQACDGLYLDASAETSSSITNNKIKINLEDVNRSHTSIEIVSITQTDGTTNPQNTVLKPNITQNIKTDYSISNNTSYTTPYW